MMASWFSWSIYQMSSSLPCLVPTAQSNYCLLETQWLPRNSGPLVARKNLSCQLEGVGCYCKCAMNFISARGPGLCSPGHLCQSLCFSCSIFFPCLCQQIWLLADLVSWFPLPCIPLTLACQGPLWSPCTFMSLWEAFQYQLPLLTPWLLYTSQPKFWRVRFWLAQHILLWRQLFCSRSTQRSLSSSWPHYTWSFLVGCDEPQMQK